MSWIGVCDLSRPVFGPAHCHLLNTNADTDSGLDDPSSFHPGGANALFADGSVHFLRNVTNDAASTPMARPVIPLRVWSSRRSVRGPAARSSALTRIEGDRACKTDPTSCCQVCAVRDRRLPGCGGQERGPLLAGGREVKSWIAELHDPKPQVRRQAVLKLGNVGDSDPTVADALAEALRRHRPAGPRDAVLAVVKLKQPGGRSRTSSKPEQDRQGRPRSRPGGESISGLARPIERETGPWPPDGGSRNQWP